MGVGVVISLMIHVILCGDLGNWLFQYAIGRHLALRHNTSVELNTYRLHSITNWVTSHVRRKLGAFSLQAQFNACRPGWHIQRRRYFQEQHWGDDLAVLDLPDNAYLSGYFQSEAYFHPIAPILRRELAFNGLPTEAALMPLAERLQSSNSVAVHVRRGDYLRSELHQVCTLAYYRRAAIYLRERLADLRFFVFSDDPVWCRAHFPSDQFECVELTVSRKQPTVDMYLMSICRHQIIANSTFSWWAAWLNNQPGQIVVTPDRWFNCEPLNADAMRFTVPERWARISVADDGLGGVEIYAH